MTVAIMQGSRRRMVVQARACAEVAPPIILGAETTVRAEPKAIERAPEIASEPKRKGRPPGSKNKPKAPD